MNNLSFNPRPAGEEPRAGIVRLIRRTCVLREQGDEAAARMGEAEVARVVAACRATEGAAVLPEAEVHALFAAEQARVAEAAILSELLAPRLLAALPLTPDPPESRPVRSVASPAPAAAAPAGPPAIPDLLDAMLAAERTRRRPTAHVPPGA